MAANPMEMDTKGLPLWLVGFLTFLSLAALGFTKVYAWIQAEGAKQREERGTEIGKATESIRREFEARIKLLEEKIRDYELKHRGIAAECAKGLELMADPECSGVEVRACFRRILEAIG